MLGVWTAEKRKIKLMIHELKCDPKYFRRVYEGQKMFEVRKNDRDYQVGDTIRLMEYDRGKQEYSEREILLKITYVLTSVDYPDGIKDGYCVLSLK